MEFLLELVVQVIGELLFAGVGEALSRRWGKLVFGVLIGFGGGWLWSAAIAHHKQPVIITIVVVAELLAVPALSGTTLFGKRLDRRTLLEFVAVGAAFVIGRWVGYSFTDAAHAPR